MPARRNPKKSRTPKMTPPGTGPAAGDGPFAAVADPLAVPAPEVPLVVDVRLVVQSPPALIKPQSAAPKAGPPQATAAHPAGGKSQQAGQPRRYAFRRS
ncbi:hypothetical protein O7634_02665 [Micromonospora sp. WMMD1120]|uniref:hypothetical protein n=1 Tax=Micromonospora sp. WMMD1120 TaxID=3016106 RepID=UPI0024174F5D|nr:hypothetical protein [Micromonospora sp. WMMD1120]MDG4805658.1 hypothetical protein [Micromonospora sp. WMMD1120]